MYKHILELKVFNKIKVILLINFSNSVLELINHVISQHLPKIGKQHKFGIHIVSLIELILIKVWWIQ